MSNDYCQTALFYPIEKKNMERAEKIIKAINEEFNKEQFGKNVDPDDQITVFYYNLEEDGIYIFDDEYAEIDYIADAISTMQKEFNATEPFFFSWSFSCSRPKPNEFGGGGCRIDPDGTKNFCDPYETLMKS